MFQEVHTRKYNCDMSTSMSLFNHLETNVADLPSLRYNGLKKGEREDKSRRNSKNAMSGIHIIKTNFSLIYKPLYKIL